MNCFIINSYDNFEFFGFCDSDFVGDVDHRKSTIGFIIVMDGCIFS